MSCAGEYLKAGAQVGQVVFDQMQIWVVLNAQLLDAPKVNGAGAAVGAIDGVALVEKQLRKGSTVLAFGAGDESGFHIFTSIKIYIMVAYENQSTFD